MTALASAALLPSVAVAASPSREHRPRVTTFAVIGDIPYGDLQLANFPYVVDQINADPDVEWVAHLGDIKAGSQPCDDTYFATIRANFDRVVDPLVYTPGDNEWTDCHRTNNGAYDPLERLAELRRVFFPVANQTLGQNPAPVRSQSRRGFPENVRFGDDGASFAAVHVVGSNNGLAPWTGLTAATAAQLAEVRARTFAALAMIDSAFDEAEDDGLVVLMLQADMFDPTVGTPAAADWSGFRQIVQRIATRSGSHDGRVLLLDGDSHGFVEDQPLAAGSQWLSVYGLRRPVPNLTRITVEGSNPVDEWLKFAVNERTGSFTYQRVPFVPTPVTHVKVNEVESQGGTPGDWVELVNLSSVDLDVSGYIVRDDDDTHVATLPAGAVIPANGHYVVEESVLGFGLGGADQVRLFARDGRTLLDSTAWTAHAASTWGRCPDGTGTFGVTSASTKGAANDCRPLVVLNEIESSGGEPGDWVELYNPGPSVSDISGWTFRDSDDTRGYVLPTGAVMAAGSYLVLDEPTFGFGLGSADSARLFRADGSLHDASSWIAHSPTSLGRCPNGIGEVRETFSVTKGAANSCEPPVTTVKVNEVESSGGVPGDWVELVNIGTSPVDLSGWSFSDNSASTYAIPAGTVIAPGGFLALDEAQFLFGLGSADSAELYRADGSLADAHTWTAHAPSTYGRCPDGLGAFVTTVAPTKGAANSCPLPPIVLNEVESNPEDWVEVLNTGIAPVDISGWLFRDNDPLRATAPYVLPAVTVVQPGQFFVIEGFGFGLGSADSATLSTADGREVFTFAWTAHASTTLGRCPDGTGDIAVTLTGTKGAANACGSPVKINEIESAGGVPGDWVELINPSSAPADISGFVIRNSNDAPEYTVPAGTVIPASGFLVVDETTLGFGFDASDSVRLLGPGGGSPSTRTPGPPMRPRPTGAAPTGRASSPTPSSRPRAARTSAQASRSSVRGRAVRRHRRRPGHVVHEQPVGPRLRGFRFDGAGAAVGRRQRARHAPPPRARRHRRLGARRRQRLGGRQGAAFRRRHRRRRRRGRHARRRRHVDRLRGRRARQREQRRQPQHGAPLRHRRRAGPLTATREWDLTAPLPVTGPNTGIEAVTFVPDSYLVAAGLVDVTTGAAYDPARYPDHAGGLFFVGVEATGGVYAFELDHADGSATLITSFASGFPGVMALEFDAETETLWALCDDTCLGRSSTFRVGTTGIYELVRSWERPAGMPNLNNEGFAIAPLAECAGGVRPVFWSDDADTGGNSLRIGTVACPVGA